MSGPKPESGYAKMGSAALYYEIAGAGSPLVMIHAGVADSRQWNNEFAAFSNAFRVIRYDMRGYGKSDPVEGEYSNLQDLVALLDHLAIHERAIVMGCSMGGGLALDFALDQPSQVRGLIMVSSGPEGLELDVPSPELFAEAGEAYKAGDLDRVAEIETQIWFDGMGRSPDQVNPGMRKLAYKMNRIALDHDAKGLGKRLKDAETPAAEHLGGVQVPVLAIVGAHDIPYILAAADHLVAHVPTATKVVLEDAAHLCNLDHPQAFETAVRAFVDALP